MPLRVTDAAGEQMAAAAPLNMLLNAGPCPHCVKAASENIMEAVRKHGKQTNDLHVQELMRLAMATPKRAVIRSHNTLKYKIGVQCTCCKHVYAEVDTDISSTGGSKGLGGQGEFANRLRKFRRLGPLSGGRGGARVQPSRYGILEQRATGRADCATQCRKR